MRGLEGLPIIILMCAPGKTPTLFGVEGTLKNSYPTMYMYIIATARKLGVRIIQVLSFESKQSQ